VPKNYYQDQMLLPFSAKYLFNIVIDIEKYPEFIPWCNNIKITSLSEKKINAIVQVKFKGIKAQYVSNIEYQEPTDDEKGSIKVISVEGSFKYLYNLWEFIPEGKCCLVKFYIEYEFRSFILQSLINLVYKKAQEKIISAFKNRAYEIA
jgi:coenzyme Q-binding protein COQ10